MKKEYKKPSAEVVKIAQSLLLPASVNDETSTKPSYAPRMGRGKNGLDEDEELDEEEDW